MRKILEKICPYCGEKFRVESRHNKVKYCSRICYRNAQRKTIIKNYRRYYVNGKRVYEHRLIYELATGEILTNQDVIHHKDNDKHNNQITNLEKLNWSEHRRVHNLQINNDASFDRIGNEVIKW